MFNNPFQTTNQQFQQPTGQPSWQENYNILVNAAVQQSQKILQEMASRGQIQVNDAYTLQNQMQASGAKQIAHQVINNCYTRDQFGNPIQSSQITQQDLQNLVKTLLGNLYQQLMMQKQSALSMQNSMNFNNPVNTGFFAQPTGIYGQTMNQPMQPAYNQRNVADQINSLYGPATTKETNTFPTGAAATPSNIFKQPTEVRSAGTISNVIMPENKSNPVNQVPLNRSQDETINNPTTESKPKKEKKPLNFDGIPEGHPDRTYMHIYFKNTAPNELWGLTWDGERKLLRRFNKMFKLPLREKIAETKDTTFSVTEDNVDTPIKVDTDTIASNDNGTLVIPHAKLEKVYTSEESAIQAASNMIDRSKLADEYNTYVADVTYTKVTQVNVPFDVAKVQLPDIMKHTMHEVTTKKTFNSFYRALTARKVNLDLRDYIEFTFKNAFNEYAKYYLLADPKDNPIKMAAPDHIEIDDIKDVLALLSKDYDQGDLIDFFEHHEFEENLQLCINHAFDAIRDSAAPFMDIDNNDAVDATAVLTMPELGMWIKGESSVLEYGRCFDSDGALLPEYREILASVTFVRSKGNFVLTNGAIGPLECFNNLAGTIENGIPTPFNYRRSGWSHLNCRVGVNSLGNYMGFAPYGEVEIDLVDDAYSFGKDEFGNEKKYDVYDAATGKLIS